MSVLMIVALLLILAGGALVGLVQQSTSHSTAALVIGKVLQWGFALGSVVLAFAVISYDAPDVKERHWYWITPGSVAGVMFWAIVSVAMRRYGSSRHSSHWRVGRRIGSAETDLGSTARKPGRRNSSSAAHLESRRQSSA
jgi:MFS family permease